MVAIRVRFDGKVFIPDEPVDHALPRDQLLILHVEIPAEPPATASENAWDVLDEHAGKLDMPADWSAEHDHYLYGTPKRQQRPEAEK